MSVSPKPFSEIEMTVEKFSETREPFSINMPESNNLSPTSLIANTMVYELNGITLDLVGEGIAAVTAEGEGLGSRAGGGEVAGKN